MPRTMHRNTQNVANGIQAHLRYRAQAAQSFRPSPEMHCGLMPNEYPFRGFAIPCYASKGIW